MRIFLQRLHEKVKGLEQAHGVEPSSSLKTGRMIEDARPKYIALSLQTLTELYYGMSMGVSVAPATEHFITSDSPTVWYNPEAYKWPPFWRSPGLAQEKIEVTMPLTPRYALYLSHNDKINGYRELPAGAVQELNRRTSFHCDQWFVSWQGEVRQQRFDPGAAPEDRWENTPEGRRAIEQQKQYEELQRLYKGRLSTGCETDASDDITRYRYQMTSEIRKKAERDVVVSGA